MVPQRKAEEDQVIEREAPQQEELVVTTESPEEEDQEKEEDQCISSDCPAAGRKQQHCQHLPVILLSSGEVASTVFHSYFSTASAILCPY